MPFSKYHYQDVNTVPPQIHHQINKPDQEGAGKENQILPIKNKIYVNFFNDFFVVFPQKQKMKII